MLRQVRWMAASAAIVGSVVLAGAADAGFGLRGGHHGGGCGCAAPVVDVCAPPVVDVCAAPSGGHHGRLFGGGRQGGLFGGGHRGGLLGGHHGHHACAEPCLPPPAPACGCEIPAPDCGCGSSPMFGSAPIMAAPSYASAPMMSGSSYPSAPMMAGPSCGTDITPMQGPGYPMQGAGYPMQQGAGYPMPMGGPIAGPMGGPMAGPSSVGGPTPALSPTPAATQGAVPPAPPTQKSESQPAET